MSEQEYRKAIAAVLAKVEAEARRLGRKVILPAAFGAGLALGAGGCGDDSAKAPAADTYIPRDTAIYGVDAGPWPDTFTTRDIAAPDAIYAADSGPWPDRSADSARDADVVRDASTSDATRDGSGGK